MSISEELSRELREAMKARDSRRRDVIRQIETEVATLKSDPRVRGEVDDDFYRKVIASYVKKMDKAKEEYEGYGDRGAAMAEKLGFEVDYLSRWLPKRLDEDATRLLVADAVAEMGLAGEDKAAGRIIGYLMKIHGQDLDGGLVNRIVREEIGRE